MGTESTRLRCIAVCGRVVVGGRWALEGNRRDEWGAGGFAILYLAHHYEWQECAGSCEAVKPRRSRALRGWGYGEEYDLARHIWGRWGS